MRYITQKGFGLVELLVSLAVAAIVMIGIYQFNRDRSYITLDGGGGEWGSKKM